jgi:uncharacterized protein YbgA (DUF1722 family)/uncharacterized protein YbbK (DUF523 family)
MTGSDKPLGSWRAWHDEDTAPSLGVSSCLVGQEVRFDGGHTRNPFVVDQLGRWFDCVPVCPEVEMGMGIPRPTIRLEEHSAGVRLVAPSTGEDFTARMSRFSKRRVRELQKSDLDGYVLKKSSPSCGMERLRVYGSDGPIRRDGVGFFARELMERWPALPIEEEGRLNDARLRENFIERVFCRNRWRTLVSRGLSRKSLIAFHTAHKLLLLAHNQAGYRRLGALVGNAGRIPDRELYASYEQELQRVMSTPATARKHANVLQHALGYMKKVLDAGEKKEILGAIEDYRAGMIPLVVPMAVLRFNIRKHDVDYLLAQLYFDPHPKELMLRNHV